MGRWMFVVLAGCGFHPGAAPVTGDAVGGGDGANDGPITFADSVSIDAIPDDLIAWYQMETLDGGVVVDSTGHGHTGSCVSCPTVVTGKLGNGFHFDGNANRVEVTPAINTPTGFTVAFWVWFDSFPPSGYSCPVNKYFGMTNSDTWQLCYVVAGTEWLFGSQGAAGFDFLVHAPGPQTMTWYHAAITWDGTTKQIWIDGTSITSDTQAGITFDTDQITFGADLTADTQDAAFAGITDDIRIYNRALTPAEITALP